ncbi:hypothetical protein JCM11491_003677 [Sporobolomyces phaffii]
MNLEQEIADRLVTAVREQDVLFTLFWINEANKERLLDAVIERRHSSERCTALESIAKSSFSQLRQVLLQVLLLSGADSRLSDALEFATDCKNRQVVELLKGWKTVDRQDLKVPLRLLSLPLAEAGDVIDSTLPAPPNAENLTGYNPLPNPSQAPPAAVERERTPLPVHPVEVPAATPPSRRESPRPRSERKRSFSARASPEPSTSRPRSPSASTSKRSLPPSNDPSPRPSREGRRRRHDSPEEGRSRSKSRLGSPRTRPRLVLESTNCIRVNVARFPVGWNGLDLQAMFEDIGVPSKTILCHSTYWPTYAFLDVDRDDANRCIRLLEGTMQGDARIRVNFAGRQHNSFRDPTRPQVPARPDSSPNRPSHSSSRFPPTASRSDPSRQRFSPPATSSNSIATGDRGVTRNVMIVNLPYDETDEARIVVNKLRYFDLHRLADHDQAVAWFPDTPRGDHLVKLWDDYVVDGRRLKVVFAKEGLSAVEAIEDYFKGAAGRGRDGSSRPQRARSRSRSERSRSRRRSRSPSVSRVHRGEDEDDLDSRSSRSRKSSSKRSKRSSHRSRSVESNTSYGPSPPPPDVNASNRYAVTTNRTGPTPSRASSTRYKPTSSSSSSRRHRERSTRSRD